MKLSPFKRLNLESRRIRWSSRKRTTQVLIAALITLLIMAVVIVAFTALFTWIVSLF